MAEEITSQIVKKKYQDFPKYQSSLCRKCISYPQKMKTPTHMPSSLGEAPYLLSRPFRKGQDFLVNMKEHSSPLRIPFLFLSYLQPIELTFAPQIFLLLLTNKNWTSLWEGVPEVVGRKAGSPVPRTLAADAMFCIITLFLSPWFAPQWRKPTY